MIIINFDKSGRKFSKLEENTVGKGEIARCEQFLLFPHNVSKRLLLQTRKNQGLFGKRLTAFSLFPQCFQRDSFSGLGFIEKGFNPFPNKPWFLRVCSTSLSKTLWEKEKLLITSNFSCSHNVFYPFGELSAIFITFEIVVCKLFEFGRV